MIKIACGTCKWGVVQIERKKIIDSIKQHNDSDVWGGYICSHCQAKLHYERKKREDKRKNLTTDDIKALLTEMANNKKECIK